MSTRAAITIVSVVALAVVVGIALLGDLRSPVSWRTDAGEKLTTGEPRLPERFRPFEMARTVTSGDFETNVLHLVYTDYRNWKETLVSSTRESSPVGTSQEVRDGRLVGHPDAESPRGYPIPGPWFLDAQGLVRRANASPGSTITTETVGGDFVVIVVRGDIRLEMHFDIETGIPVFFEDVTNGRLYERHEVTSLISQGRRIR